MPVRAALLGCLVVACVLPVVVGQAPITSPGQMSSAKRAIIKAQMRNLLSGKRGFIPILSYLRVRGGSILNASPARPTKRPGITNPAPPIPNGELGTKYSWMYVVPNQNRWLSRTSPVSGKRRGYGAATMPGTGASSGGNFLSGLPLTNPISSSTTAPPASVQRDPTEANGRETGETSRAAVLQPETGDALTREYGDRNGNVEGGSISVSVNSTHVRHEAGDSGLSRDAQPIAIGPASQGALVHEQERGSNSRQIGPSLQSTSARRVKAGVVPGARNTGLSASASAGSVVKGADTGLATGGALQPQNPPQRPGSMAKAAGVSTGEVTNAERGTGLGTTSSMNSQFTSDSIGLVSRGSPGNIPAFYAAVNSPDVQNAQPIATNGFTVTDHTVTKEFVTPPPVPDYRQYSTVYIADLIVPAEANGITAVTTGSQNGRTVETPGSQTSNSILVLTDQNQNQETVPVVDSSQSKVMFVYAGYLNNPNKGITQDATWSTIPSKGTQFDSTSTVNNPRDKTPGQLQSQWDITTSYQTPPFTVQAFPIPKTTVQDKFNTITSSLATPAGNLYTVGLTGQDLTSPPSNIPSTVQQRINTSEGRATTASRNTNSAVKTTTDSFGLLFSTLRQRQISLQSNTEAANAGTTTFGGSPTTSDIQATPQTIAYSPVDGLMAPPLVVSDGQSLPNPGNTTQNYSTVSGMEALSSYPYDTTTPVDYSTPDVVTSNSSNVTTASPFGQLNGMLTSKTRIPIKHFSKTYLLYL